LILPDIKEVAKVVTNNIDEQNELIQEVVLKCYDNETKVKALPKDKVKGWVFIVARNLYTDKKRRKSSCLQPKLASKNVNNFIHIETGDDNFSNVTDFQDALFYFEAEETPDPTEKIKTFEGMMNELTFVERIWIRDYIDSGMNVLEMHRKNNISRKKIDDRIKEILERWKHLDIYLPQ